jgi:hypothetical protein
VNAEVSYYEVIYETGNSSIISADSDEEALAGLKEHHRRAMSGETGRGESTARSDLSPGEQGFNPAVMDYPAERISRVLKYDDHPATFGEDQTVSKDEFNTALKNYLKDTGDVINVMEVAAFIRDMTNSQKAELEGVHDSRYKMAETEELDLSSLEEGSE